MAVHTHAFWSKNGGQVRNASYLSGDGRLYFDDPSTDPVAERDLPALSLADSVKLTSEGRPTSKAMNTGTRGVGILRSGSNVLSWSMASRRTGSSSPYGENGRINIEGYDLGCPVKADWNAAKDDSFKPDGAFSKIDLSGLFQTLEVPATNIDGFTRWFEGEGYEGKNARKRRPVSTTPNGFGADGWRYGWPINSREHRPRRASPSSTRFTRASEVGTKPDNFEMDVVAVRGYRVFLFSCTVDQKTHLVKSKLFEAANRTDRIGGEHARAAMVCLHEHPREVLQATGGTLARLRHPALFGKPHVVGGTASCKVATGGETPRDVNLLEGIRQWVAT